MGDTRFISLVSWTLAVMCFHYSNALKEYGGCDGLVINDIESFSCYLSEQNQPGNEILSFGNNFGNVSVTEVPGDPYNSTSYIGAKENSLIALDIIDVDEGGNFEPNNELIIDIRGSENENVTINGTFILLDINDNGPVFVKEINKAVVYELAQNGAALNLEDADFTTTDKDGSDDGTVLYQIVEPENSPFIIGGRDGDVEITVNSIIDFEQNQVYNLTIRAIEDNSGQLLNGGNTTLIISVIDGDDLNPAFTYEEYRVEVTENQTHWNNSDIYAYDQDLDINRPVKYSLRNSSSADYFEISSTTGELTMKKAIDRETDSKPEPLIVEATQDDNYQRVGRTRVVLSVLDINDNCPYFKTTTNITGYVYELSKNGTNVTGSKIYDDLVITASDPDEEFVGDFDLESDTFDLVSTVDGSVIIQVKDNSQLDCTLYENCNKIFQCKVFVSDSIDSSCVSTLDVYVQLLEVNNHDPVTQENHTVNVQEDVVQQAVIIQINVTDKDSGVDGEIEYKITSNTNKFNINDTTGKIQITGQLDAEETTEHFLVVQACDRSKMQRRCTFTDVKVIVEDINEFEPRFSEDWRQISVYENEHSEYVFTAVATDDDVSATIIYTLMGGNGDFNINSTTGDVSKTNDLDREQRSLYNLQIYATDGKYDAMLNLTVVVKDVNDNHPQVESAFSFKIQENLEAGSDNITINASDIDDLENRQLTYYFYDSSLYEYFSLNPYTGLLTTNMSMDREFQSSYDVIIVINDNSTVLPLYNLTKVTINILDENDNPPVIKSTLCGSFVHVVEGAAEGTVLGYIEADDDDQPGSENSEIIYQLCNTTGSAFLYFKIDEMTGKLTTTEAPIDRELHPFLTLCIVALNPDNYTSEPCIIDVIVDDVNDEQPTFNQDSLEDEIYLYEDEATTGTTILTVLATDNDTYPNNLVWFTIREETDMPHFYIDNDITASSGSIKISNAPVSKEPYILTISVHNLNSTDRAQLTDGTQLTDGAQTTLYIYILDNLMYNIVILPIEEQTTYIDDVWNVAIMIHTTSYGNKEDISYSIIQETFQSDMLPESELLMSSALFVDEFGELTMNSSASIGQYVAIVTAYNTSLPSINDNTTVVITVISSNNTDPEFTHGEPVLIPSEVESGSVVFNLTATDDDYPEFGNGEIRFNITHEESTTGKESIFSLDPVTGSITLLVSPVELAIDNTAKNITVCLDVEVYDLSIERGVDTDILNFIIQLPNPSPSIINAPTQFKMKEEEEPGYLFQVKANDEDTPTADLSFKLAGNGAKHFKIYNDGRVYSTRVFDSENGDITFEIVVIVSDTSGFQDFAVITIVIVDINDNPPVFKELFLFLVSEDIPVNGIIGEVFAYDDDIGSTNFTNQVKYRLLGNSSYFGIDADMGEIYSTTDLDRETDDVFNLTIEAFNEMLSYSNTSFYTRTTVLINISDVNDNEPMFEKSSYKVYFTNYNDGIGTDVVTVHAVDKDKGLNSMIVYSLSADDSSLEYFTINKTTGTIATKREFAQELLEKLPTFNMVAHATDKGSPPLSGKVNVEITLAMPDEPVFNKSQSESETVEIKEGTTDTIRFPSADLPDDNQHAGNVTYQITGGDGFGIFCIPDPLVNILKPIAELDREETANYTLIITAGICDTQEKCRNLSSTCETRMNEEIKEVTVFEEGVLTQNQILLKILVQDVNDERPIIKPDPKLSVLGYIAGIRDDAEYGYEMFKVEAYDEDTTSELMYEMKSESGNTQFGIDPNTGHVFGKGYLHKYIDYSDPGQSWKDQVHNYTIRVKDEANFTSEPVNSKLKILSRFEHILLIFYKPVEVIKQEQFNITQNLEEKFGMKIILESLSPLTQYIPYETDPGRSQMMIYALSKSGGYYTYDQFTDQTSCNKEENKDGVDDCKLVPIKKMYSTQNDIFGLVMIIFASVIFVASCVLVYLVIYTFEEYQQARRNDVLRESMMRKKQPLNGIVNPVFDKDENFAESNGSILSSEISTTTITEVGHDVVNVEDDDDILPKKNGEIYESMEQLSELVLENDNGSSSDFDPNSIDWNKAIVPVTPNGTRKTTVARVYVDSDNYTRFIKGVGNVEKKDEEMESEVDDPFVIAPGTITGEEDAVVSEDHEVFRDSSDNVINDSDRIDNNDGTTGDFVSIPMSPSESDVHHAVEDKKVHFQDDESITAL